MNFNSNINLGKFTRLAHLETTILKCLFEHAKEHGAETGAIDAFNAMTKVLGQQVVHSLADFDADVYDSFLGAVVRHVSLSGEHGAYEITPAK